MALGVILIVGFRLVGAAPLRHAGDVAVDAVSSPAAGRRRKVEGGGAPRWPTVQLLQGALLTPLIVHGALLLAAMLVIGLIAGVLGLGAMFSVMAGGGSPHMGGVMAAMGAGLLALFAVLILGTAVSMALWFAPALIVFRNMAPVDALRTSAMAVLKNWLPCLVFGLLYIVAAIVASIPFVLGWWRLVPLTLLTLYTSYQDLFALPALEDAADCAGSVPGREHAPRVCHDFPTRGSSR